MKKKVYFDDPHLNELTLKLWAAWDKTTKKNNPYKGLSRKEFYLAIKK